MIRSLSIPLEPACKRFPLLVLTISLILAGCGQQQSRRDGGELLIPVEIAPVEVGPIVLTRNLSGTLRASNDFIVAPKISGQVRTIRARVSDAVEQGDILAELDDEPLIQELKRAEADLLVAEANLIRARAQGQIAERGMERVRQLSESGFVSDTEYDAALTDELAAEAALRVAEAQVGRAEAALESARIRLDYTKVRAEWTGGDSHRVVAERFVDEGDTVSTNQRMFRVVNLSTLLAVVYITEKDYPKLRIGDPVTVEADAYPGRKFDGEVIRIAPVFSELSRQAAVEFRVPNPDSLLNPGMFVRASLVIDSREQARIIPQAAISRREGRDGVFLVNSDGESVSWQPVEIGILEENRVEVTSPELNGQVVILGQHLLEDGSRIRIEVEEESTAK